MNKKNNCISNAEKSQELHEEVFYQDIGLFWVQVRKRNGTAAHMLDTCDRTANKMAQQFKEAGHPIFTATSAVSRGNVETTERQMYHSLQWRFHEHRCFVSNKSFCESSQYLRGCYELVLQICFERGKQEHVPTPVDNRITTVVEAEELDMLMSSPNLAQ